MSLSLGQILSSAASPLDVSSQFSILLDIACGLNFIHGFGVIHRDLNLGNFLLGSDGKIKICDFGQAAVLKDAEMSLSADRGAQYYRAPEACDAYYERSADVWSFGIVLGRLGKPDETLVDLNEGEMDAMIKADPYLLDVCLTQWRFTRNQINRALNHKRRVLAMITFEPFKELAERCTLFDPSNRPTFKEVIQLLLQIEKFSGLQRANLKQYLPGGFAENVVI